MRILVTGSRDWPGDPVSKGRIADALWQAAAGTPPEQVTVVHGAARGVDTHAHIAAVVLGFTPEAHAADWNGPCRDTCRHTTFLRYGRPYCPAAGGYRNQEMVDAGADVCLAFYLPGVPCAGTTDCDRRADRAGIPVTRVAAP